ncbi:hypothetical protein BOX15_Mlig025204g1, partial [Macrostomum lignano]
QLTMSDKADSSIGKKDDGSSTAGGSGSLVISIVFIIISFVIIVLVFVILTVKRQITRARSRQIMFASAPVPIATGATTGVRQRVGELVNRNRDIQRIPTVFNDCFKQLFEEKVAERASSHYVFRLKAADEFQEMVQHLGQLGFRRGVHQSVDSYLANLKKTTLAEVNIDESLRSLCALHEHCVSNPLPFGHQEYEQFRDLLASLRSLVDERVREQQQRSRAAAAAAAVNRQSESRLSRRLSTASSDNSETNPLIDLGFTNVGFSSGGAAGAGASGTGSAQRGGAIESSGLL